jgi:RHS repeat-associated protein
LTARGSDSFGWDPEDRLITATVDSAATTFSYNGDGLRDSLTFDSSTTTFTWDVSRSIPQVVDDETYQYVYGLGRIAQVGSSDTLYYLTDGLGSTMALTDEDGDVVNTYDYDVFGGVRGMTGSQPNDYTFAGEQVDGSTGLQYLRARYYDMETGRFISADPLQGSFASPSTQNRYAYSLNEPCGHTDRLGLASTVDCKGSASAQGLGRYTDEILEVTSFTPFAPIAGPVLGGILAYFGDDTDYAVSTNVSFTRKEGGWKIQTETLPDPFKRAGWVSDGVSKTSSRNDRLTTVGIVASGHSNVLGTSVTVRFTFSVDEFGHGFASSEISATGFGIDALSLTSSATCSGFGPGGGGGVGIW